MPDPNGGHAIEFGPLCKCGAELCHPNEIKQNKCYSCLADEVLASEQYMGHEHYAKTDDRP